MTLAGIMLILASIYLYTQRLTPVNLVMKSYQPVRRSSILNEKSQQIPSYPPEYIEIPDLKIKLPIIPSKIMNGKWETTSKGVSYLDSSPIPGDTGNSVLYGHNWEKLLGKLIKIKPGARIVITYSDGSAKNFIAEYTGTVKPDQIGILNQTADKRLTIYTCTGFLDSMRFVVVAFPEKNLLTSDLN